MTDQLGRVLAFALTPGHRGDAPVAQPLLDTLPPSDLLLADTAYDSDRLRQFLSARSTTPVIPNNPTRKRVHPFDRIAYRARNAIERTVGGSRIGAIDQEIACDQWVTTRPGLPDAQTYGETLLKAVRLFGRPGMYSPVYAAMAPGKRALAGRLRRLGQHRPAGRFAPILILVLAAAALALGPLFGGAEPAYTPASPSPAARSGAARAPGTARPSLSPASASSSARPQVTIEAKFIETSGDVELGGLGDAGSSSHDSAAASTVYSAADLQKLMVHLNGEKGVDLLSAPRVTTQSGQRAKIEVIRKFWFATAFEPTHMSGGRSVPATPTNFANRNVGVTLDVTPFVASDNTIDLELAPSVVDFVGFINYGAGKPGREQDSDALDDVMRSHPLSETDQMLNQPVFDTRRITSMGNIHSGQTLMLGAFTRQDVQVVTDTDSSAHRTRIERKIEHRLFIFVTARILDSKTAAAGM